MGKGETCWMFFFPHERPIAHFSPFVGELNCLDVLDLYTLVLISTSLLFFLLLDIPYSIHSVTKIVFLLLRTPHFAWPIKTISMGMLLVLQI